MSLQISKEGNVNLRHVKIVSVHFLELLLVQVNTKTNSDVLFQTHPAPLPEATVARHNVPRNAKAVPPKPGLKLSRVANG